MLKILPRFAKGKIFEVEAARDIIEYRQGQQIHILPRNGHMKFVVDGEIIETGELDVEMKSKAIRVLVPYLQV